jgi:superfamily II RNA helicase
MSRREYEQLEVRGRDDEEESEEGGLLPVVVFCFSKKKCEEIVDFFKGQDLTSAKDKSEVKRVMGKVIPDSHHHPPSLPHVPPCLAL